MGQAATRVVELDYDPTNGNLLSRTETGTESTYPTGSFTLVTSYPDYNAAGQVETLDPPGFGSSDQTTYTYDPVRGDLLPLTRQDPLLSAPTQLGHDPFNRRSRITDPNGVTTETEYDSMGRVSRIIQRSDDSTLPTPPSAADLVTTYLYPPVALGIRSIL
jgi:YD repeat-containing protein